MKFRMLAVVAVLMACVSFSYADIISNTIADDGDGVVSCYTYGFQKTADHEFLLNIDGSHNIWDSGHIQGDIITDSDLDPSLTLSNSIDNDTGSTWTDYHVKVTMSKVFTLDNVTVANPGWTSVTTAPAQVGSDWIGYIDYFAGSPIPNLGAINFSYRLSFTGSASFQEELTPTPEPGTLVLLAGGLIGLVAIRRRFA
jgi:PEP-CTERM motif